MATCVDCGLQIEGVITETSAGTFHPRTEDCLAAAQARIAELEAEIAKWKELTGLDEPSWGAKLTGLILHGPGISTADITYDWKPAKSASDND